MYVCNVYTSRQHPHDALKSHQGHGIRRKRPQEARQETTPISPPPSLSIDGLRSVPPPLEASLAVTQSSSQRIRHDALLDHVARVTRDPKDLRAQSARPEVDDGRAQIRPLAHQPAEDIVASPPEEEEGPEEQRRPQTVVQTPNPVMPHHLAHAVDGPRVQTLRLARRVLDLQPRLDVLDWRRDEADRCSGHDARNTVAQRWE